MLSLQKQSACFSHRDAVTRGVFVVPAISGRKIGYHQIFMVKDRLPISFDLNPHSLELISKSPALNLFNSIRDCCIFAWWNHQTSLKMQIVISFLCMIGSKCHSSCRLSRWSSFNLGESMNYDSVEETWDKQWLHSIYNFLEKNFIIVWDFFTIQLPPTTSFCQWKFCLSLSEVQ